MNLRNLSDDVVLSETKRWARIEQGALTTLLFHIKEVERRRLFSTLKYQSINQYVEKELGYSNDEAWRRANASRLLDEIPEIEEKISSGELNLTNLGLAQALFQREKRQAKSPFGVEKKKEVLLAIVGKSTREAAKTLWSHSTLPAPTFREQVRVLNAEMSEYNFAADQETQLDIERLKGLLAHSDPGMTLGDLIKKLCKLGLKEWDRTMKTAPPRSRNENKRSQTKIERQSLQTNSERKRSRVETETPSPRRNNESTRSQTVMSTLVAAEPPSQGATSAHRRNIESTRSQTVTSAPPRSDSKAEQSRQVWRNAECKCTNCGSYFALQEDHKIPRAKGGSDSLENKRLLCRNCNQRAAIEQFGCKKMETFVKSPAVLYARTFH